MKFKITLENQNQRLDKFLTQKLPDLSRNQIQKQIKLGLVLVNGKTKLVHYFLKPDDIISIVAPTFSAKGEPALGGKSEYDKFNLNLKQKIKIIKQTDDYLVVEKPAGLIIHPAQGVKEKTLIEYITKKYPEIEKINDISNVETQFIASQKNRPGIVHRLDKETSGLIVIARTQKMFEHLKRQFKNRKVNKIYQTLVEAVVEKDDGKIITPLKKNKQNIMIARTDENTENAKDAVTEFRVLKRFKHYTLLEVKIKTGRTHQIRAHLKSIGHPIVGDQLYKTLTRKAEILKRRIRDRQNLDRIFLHAYKLRFYDLENKWMEFNSKLPKELTEFLKEIKIK